jgi:lactobin A/cerein 7B family class IIb bacteriocin
MENLKEIKLAELNENEYLSVDGGCIALIIAGIGVCFGAYGAGYLTGKAIFTK